MLCPHSLSGLEATLWVQKYPDEVEAIVGLDMTLSGTFVCEEAEKSYDIQNMIYKIADSLELIVFL